MFSGINVKKQTFLFTFFLLLVTFTAIVFTTYTNLQERLESVKDKNFNKIRSSYNKNIKKHLENYYLAKADFFLSPEIIKAVYEKDRVKLHNLINNKYSQAKKSDKYLRQVHFHLNTGRTFYRAHKPKSFGDNIAALRPMAKKAHEVKEIIGGFESGKNGLSYRIFKPLFYNREYIGALEIGAIPTKLLDIVTYFNNIEGMIYLQKSTLQKNAKEIQHSNIKDKKILEKLPKGYEFYHNIEVKYKDKNLVAYKFDIKNFSGNVIGKFIFFNNLTKEYNDFYTQLGQLMLIFSVSFVLVLFVINIGFSKIVASLNRNKLFTDSILDNSAHAIITTDTKGNITLFNKKAEDMLGYSNNEMVGKRTFMSLHKDGEIEKKAKEYSKELNIDIDASFDLFTLKTDIGQDNEDEWIYIDKNGREFPVSLHITALKDQEGNITGYMGMAKDISESKEKEKLIKDYVTLVDKNIITSSTDLKGTITYVSDAFSKISGYTKDELLGQNHRIIKHPDMPKELYDDLWKTISNNSTWNGEIKNRKKDGGYYWVDVSVSPIFNENGKKIGYTAIRQDITDKKYIEQISITDGLTGIYNRRHFNELFPKIINSSKRKNELICFLIMDIDHFKQYNDTYGHQMGDDVLIRVAESIKSSLKRSDDYCFRLGGEEFGVLFKSSTKEEGVSFAQNIRKNIEELKIEHRNNSASSYITASMGLVCKNANSIKDMDEIYKDADDYLYEAKESGRNKVCMEK